MNTLGENYDLLSQARLDVEEMFISAFNEWAAQTDLVQEIMMGSNIKGGFDIKLSPRLLELAQLAQSLTASCSILSCLIDDESAPFLGN